jgi:DNA-binding transcriptional LysR family regulator
MEMHQVRYFLAVARVLNFTRAAEECNVAQPSLTRAIKQLEHELGGELFRRERNLTHLSELGHRMLPLMQQCYESALSAKTLATSLKSGAIAPLSIALARAVNIDLLVPFLSEIVRVFPGTEFKFLRGTIDEIVGFLKKGEADIAVAGSFGESWDRLDVWPLFTEPFQLLVGAKHTLAKRKSVAPRELEKERLLSRSYCDQLQQIMEFLADQDCRSLASHEVVAEDDLLQLLEADLGVGISPKSTARTTHIKSVPLEGLDVTRTVHLYGVSGRQRSTPTTTLIKMLRAADWSRFESDPKALSPATKAKA